MGRDAKGRHFGHLKLMKIWGLKLVVSPDVFMWVMPTAITLALFAGGIYIAGHQPLYRWSSTSPAAAGSSSLSSKSKTLPTSEQREVSFLGIIDLCLTIGVVVCALLFSLLCGTTDPGAIPRVEGTLVTANSANTPTGSEKTPEEELRLKRIDLMERVKSAAHHSKLPQNESSLTSHTDDENSSLVISGGQNATHIVRLDHRYQQDRSCLGRVDPYADMTNWTYCRVCELRRPPRAAHCYNCGVCMLQSDHHCGVVGGDVALRSLRWFVLYLQCIGFGSLNTMTWILQNLFDGKNRNHPGSMALHITLLVFIGNILLMVGGLALFYTWMVFTDLTRRESQGKSNSKASQAAAVCYYHEHLSASWQEQRSKWFGNIRRVMSPPPSLIAWSDDDEADSKKIET
jgi:hypothetical protein